MENLLRKKLAAGEKPVGTFFELGSPNVMECLGHTGLDFAIIDNEHGPFEAESTLQFVRAAELTGLTPLARVREISRPAVLKLLDVGVQGLIVPNITTPEQVRQLVKYAKFAPLGERGFCPTRKDCWGAAYPATASMEENMAFHNRETLLIPQCETAECLAQIQEVAAVDGVDGIFVGPFDLSISMGMPGRFTEPAFREALSRILGACHAAGKFCVLFAPTPEGVAQGFRDGFDAVTYSLDAALFTAALREQVQRIRAML